MSRGINQAILYEKRGRNAKGQIMFNHMGPGQAAQSDMNVGAGNYPSQGIHQRNKTQILNAGEKANDSVFRSSIMSNEQMNKIANQKVNPNLRQSAKMTNMGRQANTSFQHAGMTGSLRV